MDHDLETIRWHVDRLMGNASPDAREELRSAFEGIDERFKQIEANLAELMKPPAPHSARVQAGSDPT